MDANEQKNRGKRKSKEWKRKALVRAEHLEKGLCRDCTSPALPGRTMCESHCRFAIIRKRNWRIYHGLQKPVALHPVYIPRKFVNDSEVPF